MNTDKEFVPYQIALDMKSIGFDKPCQLGWYLPHSEIAIKAGFEPHTWQLIPTHPLLNQIAAPTFSQCFRWFREKYGLLSFIDMDNYSYYRFTIYEGKGISVAPHKTYEEAELACVVKLIEICRKLK